MEDGAVGQSFHNHIEEGGAAAAQGAAHIHQAGFHWKKFTNAFKKALGEFQFFGGEVVGFLQKGHPLAHHAGGIGHDKGHPGLLGEDFPVFFIGPAQGDGDDGFAFESVVMLLDNFFDVVGLDCHQHNTDWATSFFLQWKPGVDAGLSTHDLHFFLINVVGVDLLPHAGSPL